MSEIAKEKIKAQSAFGQILGKLKNSPLNLNTSFIEDAIWPMAPMDYIETHYNLSRELQQYQPELDRQHTFNQDEVWENKTKNEHDYPLPITFYGDVFIYGNLEIAFYQSVFITGNLEVDGVLDLNDEACLFVGGEVKASGIRVSGFRMEQNTSSELLNLALIAEKINASELMLCERNIYAGKISARMLILRSSVNHLDIAYQNYEKGEFVKKKVKISTCTKHSFLSDQEKEIKALFNPKIFENSPNNDPAKDAFEALRNIKDTLDENWKLVKKDWIWKG